MNQTPKMRAVKAHLSDVRLHFVDKRQVLRITVIGPMRDQTRELEAAARLRAGLNTRQGNPKHPTEHEPLLARCPQVANQA
jgi:hypothetical protein